MQEVKSAKEIILKLRKVEVLLNQGKTLRLSCREVEMPNHTYYKWRREYGGLSMDQAK
ncbi:MAG: hypothetical protein E7015_03985 [Alphaproteobacteria bacterium]|nr:hypothetical protein [Alphaproteobacteria bacterium]